MVPFTRIAIDCMGGDHGLRVSLPAVKLALQQFPDLKFVLFGDESQISAQLGACPADRIEIVATSQVVLMSDRPSVAIRRKSDSSMRVAINYLQEGRVDAVVSAGNTGALMAMGCLVLDTLEGIERPAICTPLPTERGHCYLLDLGANVDSSAAQLHQFAMMASALSRVVDGNSSPRVALLNIGDEDIKGNEQVQLAAERLQADDSLNFVGFIEGDAIFSGDADVVVCDGFVGNVALKVCEGTAARIADIVLDQFTRSLFSRLVALLARPVLKRIYRILDPQQYNGASLLGLRGVVVKSHGDSTPEGFARAIGRARSEVRGDVLTLIAGNLAVTGGQP